MSFTAFGCRVTVSPLFTFAVTAVLIIDTTGMYRYVLFATVLHEMGHIIALFLTGNRPSVFELEPFCIRLIPKNAHLTVLRKNIVAFGGAGVNIAVCIFFIFIKQFAGMYSPEYSALSASNLALAVFNLLPLKGLDGGDIVNSLIYSLLSGSKAERTEKVVSTAVKTLLCLAGAGIFLYNRNPALLLFGLYLSVNSGICTVLYARRAAKEKKEIKKKRNFFQ